MPRSPLFSSPLLLGFDQLEDALDRISKHGSDGYPPYNVEELAPGLLRITLAVAGFTREELTIQLDRNQLLIEGRQSKPEHAVYLHQGIASRGFRRSFMLAEGIEVIDASLTHGLLSIDLQRPEQHVKVQNIRIRVPGSSVDEGSDESRLSES